MLFKQGMEVLLKLRAVVGEDVEHTRGAHRLLGFREDKDQGLQGLRGRLGGLAGQGHRKAHAGDRIKEREDVAPHAIEHPLDGIHRPEGHRGGMQVFGLARLLELLLTGLLGAPAGIELLRRKAHLVRLPRNDAADGGYGGDRQPLGLAPGGDQHMQLGLPQVGVGLP